MTEEQKQKRAEYSKKYREANKEVINRISKKWYETKSKEYREKNRDRLNAHSREYNKANREQCRESCRRYQEKNKDKLSLIALEARVKLYGLTLDEYEAYLKQQDNCCAICGTPFANTNRKTRPHIDHCHSSGEVRGLLCSRCNLAIGLLEDSQDNLQRAIDYLGCNNG